MHLLFSSLHSLTKPGYLPTDWYDFNSDYGTEEMFRALTSTLYDAGINVYLDVVLNHKIPTKKGACDEYNLFTNPYWDETAVCSDSVDCDGTSRCVCS